MEMDARNVGYDPDVMLFEIVNKMVPVDFFFFEQFVSYFSITIVCFTF